MGAILASAIVAEVRTDLVDAGAVTWSNADLLADLNEALRALCNLKVDSYVIREPVALDAGEEQVLPNGGIAIFDVLRNTVSGTPVTLVDQDLLDEATRFAAVASETADAQHWTADPRDKTRFRVYPANDGTGSVMTVYGAVPDPIDDGDPIPVGDNNEPALKAYMMGLAYRRNTQRQDLGKSQGYFQTFLTMLGLSANTQIAASPKVDQSAGAN
jgi:hypothetical protein